MERWRDLLFKSCGPRLIGLMLVIKTIQINHNLGHQLKNKNRMKRAILIECKGSTEFEGRNKNLEFTRLAKVHHVVVPLHGSKRRG